MLDPPAPPLIPADLQAEADGYAHACVALTNALAELYAFRDSHRARGRLLIARMQEAGLPEIQTPTLTLRPHADGLGFDALPRAAAPLNLAPPPALLGRGLGPFLVELPEGVTLGRARRMLPKVDTGAIAPAATLAELDEIELAVSFEVTAQTFRAALAGMAHTSAQSFPNPQTSEGGPC